MEYYSYLWLRYDGTPYYAGKGKDDRAYISDGHRVKCPAKDRIIIQHHPTEADAFDAEMFLISYYGRMDLGTGCLANLTEGGEGVSGLKQSSESKQKMRESAILRGGISDDCRLAQKEYLNNRIFSKEHRENISKAKKGVPLTSDHRRKLSEAKAQKQRTHCRKGHELIPANLYMYKGRRLCRECGRKQSLDVYYRKKEKHRWMSK
jgi:hypothetical protein